MRRWLPVLAAALVLLPALAAGQGLDCVIYPDRIVAVSSAVEGLLEKVLVDRGDLVREGQVLATLEASIERGNVLVARARAQMEAALRSGRARFEFGQRRYVRTRDLFRKEVVSVKEMDEAETAKVLAEYELLQAWENRRLAEIELDRAEAALALRTVRSPITGVVVERLHTAGEFPKQSPIFRVARIDPLRVEVIVPVAMLGRIHPGARAEVTPEDPVGGVYEAVVSIVDRVVDPASGTFGVRLALPNPDYRLPAGLKCKVRFPRPRTEDGASGRPLARVLPGN